MKKHSTLPSQGQQIWKHQLVLIAILALCPLMRIFIHVAHVLDPGHVPDLALYVKGLAKKVRHILEAFGETYRNYMRHVPAFISPFKKNLSKRMET